MRVGVNLLFLERGRTGGGETYVRELLPELEGRGVELSVFATAGGRDAVRDRLSRACWIHPPLARRGRGLRVVVEQSWLPAALARQRVDVLFSPGYVAPVLGRTPSVVTIHDTLYADLPECLPPLKRWYWRLFVPLTVTRCRRILTLSRASARSLAARFPRHAAKIRVTPGASAFAADEERARSPAAGDAVEGGPHPRPYFLTVAQHLPHKNLDVVLQAIARLRQTGLAADWVLVGPRGPATEPLRRLIRAVEAEPWVTWNEDVPPGRLRALYRGAVAFVTATRFEGFGLPVLEAMSLGCPVVCSDIPALREVAGAAARHVRAGDVGELTTAMAAMLTSDVERARLAALGHERERDFSWSRCAEETLVVLDEAARPS